MKTGNNPDPNIVYSTEHGRMCPACGKPLTGCVCSKHKPVLKGDGIVRIGRETKGRKGKGVTIITGIPLMQDDLRKLAKKFKQQCGCGGTVNKGVIEIQGDHRDLLMDRIRELGYTVRRSGG